MAVPSLPIRQVDIQGFPLISRKPLSPLCADILYDDWPDPDIPASQDQEHSHDLDIRASPDPEHADDKMNFHTVRIEYSGGYIASSPGKYPEGPPNYETAVKEDAGRLL
ncbi:hypothetical protein OROMI_023942 [Orobanche minor]